MNEPINCVVGARAFITRTALENVTRSETGRIQSDEFQRQRRESSFRAGDACGPSFGEEEPM